MMARSYCERIDRDVFRNGDEPDPVLKPVIFCCLPSNRDGRFGARGERRAERLLSPDHFVRYGRRLCCDGVRSIGSGTP